MVYLFGREDINTAGLAWSSFGVVLSTSLHLMLSVRFHAGSERWDIIDMLSLDAVNISASNWAQIYAKA